MRSSLIAAAVVTALALSGCGESGHPPTESSGKPLQDVVYVKDGLGVQWCDRLDFKRLAVLPGELVDGRPLSHVSPDGLLCSRAVVDKDPALAPVFVLQVHVFATPEEAKTLHERNSGSDAKQVSIGLPIDDARADVSERERSLLVLDRNLRVTLRISAAPAVLSAHAGDWEALMPEVAAQAVRMMRETARTQR